MSNLKAKSITGLIGLILVPGCSQPSGQDDGGMDVVSTQRHVQFVEVSEEAGLDFENVSGGPSQMYVLESMSAGAAFLDYDVDGWLDLFVVNGTRLDGPVEGATNRLYHNRAAPGREGEGRRVFREVTEEAGVGHTGWGMGCAVGDHDNDGDPDLYVTYWGPNRLYRNDGDGGFVELAESAGVADGGWGSSAAFGDVDGDGFVDLYVTNYLEFDLDNPPDRGYYKGLDDVMAGPAAVPHQADRLYRNNGDGSFTDMSAVTGLDQLIYPGLGVVFGDYDDDGDLDIYVANDTEPNLLLRNDGGWRLSEVGIVAGAAYTEDGRSQAGMGTASGDYDNDGDLDLVVNNFADDVNTLYQNQGDGTFVDMTFAVGLYEMVRPLLCWSNGFFDYDNDGWLDLFMACGHLYPQLEQYPSGVRYGQRNLLFHNEHGRYAEAGRQSGPGWAIEKVTRAAALGDYDNDGDVDLLMMNMNDKPSLLRNDGGNGNNWFGLQLEGVQSNRDAIGARVRVVAGDLAQVREVQRGYGFQSQHDPRLVFGLGGNERVDRVEIRWPSGNQQVLEDLELRNYLVVREGEDDVIAKYAGPGAKQQAFAVAVVTTPAPEPEAPSTGVSDANLTAAEHYARGTQLYDQGRHEEALGLLRGAIQLRPDYMEAYYALGVTLYAGLCRPREAAPVLEAAIQQDSSWAAIYALFGAVCLALNEPERAIESLERSIALDPSPWESHARMGVAHLRLGNTAAAERAFKTAARVAPYAPVPHLQLVRVYQMKGQQEASEREQRIFEQLEPVQDQVDLYADKIKQYPDVAEWHYSLGRALVKQRRCDEALASFGEAVRLDPGHGMAHYGMGAAFHCKGYLTQAMEAYIKAGQVDSSLVEALNDLGRVYHESGLLEAAVQAYQKAIRLRPGLALTISNLGEVYVAQGKMDEAIDAYTAALEVDSTLTATRKKLERLLAARRRSAAQPRRRTRRAP